LFVSPTAYLAQAHRATFAVRLRGGQGHDNGHAPIVAGDRHWFVVKYGIDEGPHLSQIAFGVALHEEVERQVSPDAPGVAYDGRIWVAVGGIYGPATAERFHTLVVAIDGPPAVVNGAYHTVAEPEHDHSGVDVPGLTDRRIYLNAGHRENFLSLAAREEAGHVEVVDRHIEEHTA
jgi:hypothetical protein